MPRAHHPVIAHLPLRGRVARVMWPLCAYAVLACVSPRASAAPPPPHADLAEAEPVPAASAQGATCVSFTTQAIYNNYGYDHWVQLSSACSSDARCKVVSDVNPSGVDVSVEAGKTASALLFRGSPASEFSAQVTCTLASHKSTTAQGER